MDYTSAKEQHRRWIDVIILTVGNSSQECSLASFQFQFLFFFLFMCEVCYGNHLFFLKRFCCCCRCSDDPVGSRRAVAAVEGGEWSVMQIKALWFYNLVKNQIVK